jgi:hypothetical protein
MGKTSKKDFPRFQKRVEDEIMTHRIIRENHYTNWFAKADLSLEEVKSFAVQFSVFSNLFIVAQLKKVINSVSLESMHGSKEILMNELGVVFRRRSKEDVEHLKKREQDKENEGDPAYVNTEGTVESGTFHFKAAHFEWLLEFAKPLGLGFGDIGKSRHGAKSTLFFTDALEQIYASEDYSEAAGASYAIENWAAAGFWKELIQGLKSFKEKSKINLPLSFFTWHDKVEDQHAAHTQDELKEVYFYEDFDEDRFIDSGIRMLDACAVFWDGLNEARLKRQKSENKYGQLTGDPRV